MSVTDNIRRLLPVEGRGVPQRKIVAKLIDAQTACEDVVEALWQMRDSGEVEVFRESKGRGRGARAAVRLIGTARC